MLTSLRTLVLTAALMASPVAFAAPSSVMINGTVLDTAQLAALEAQIGSRIAPGRYLVNWQNGCWVHLETGAAGCQDRAGDVHSRYGSGSRDGRGNWSHRSNAAGGSVGGTSDGCIYTSFGWSNC